MMRLTKSNIRFIRMTYTHDEKMEIIHRHMTVIMKSCAMSDARFYETYDKLPKSVERFIEESTDKILEECTTVDGITRAVFMVR